ncbi:root hair defective 3 GTP-binding protein-domain-containing protein [Baffinella frigidus]|nr:root hair defective 3 GTP-binding protein-domain-containing protein [Cryptophyta sp. CCMP2293]
MAENNTEGCQVITADMKYNEGLATYIKDVGLGADANKYHVVSIIGGQSSGKSTLLNRMFGTSFDMMDSQRGRSQTTKGIWCARAADSHTLVLDVEGTDGREKEDQKAFEGKSALFCLAFTDVLIVNMWMHEVGRFNAANLPLLKTVFEAHLRLSHSTKSKTQRVPSSGSAGGKGGRPLLLFILRDCDGTTPVDKLRDTIVSDLTRLWGEAQKPEALAEASLEDFSRDPTRPWGEAQKPETLAGAPLEDFLATRLWGEAQKPEALADASLEDFFAVECEALPHFVYQKDEWSAKTMRLSSSDGVRAFRPVSKKAYT